MSLDGAKLRWVWTVVVGDLVSESLHIGCKLRAILCQGALDPPSKNELFHFHWHFKKQSL